MRDYMNGWKNRNEVWIPPLEQIGFPDNVIRRKPIEPVLAYSMKVEINDVVSDAASDAVISEEDTVLLNTKDRVTAYVKRTQTGELVEIERESFIIGKSTSVDYVISDNPTISRRHARIFKAENEYYLEDMGSSNHSFLSEKLVSEPVKLSDGAIFSLSDEQFQFLIMAGQNK